MIREGLRKSAGHLRPTPISVLTIQRFGLDCGRRDDGLRVSCPGAPVLRIPPAEQTARIARGRATMSMRLTLARLANRIFPPLISNRLTLKYIYPYNVAQRDGTEFRSRAVTGSEYHGNRGDVHGYMFGMHGYFDWRMIAVAGAVQGGGPCCRGRRQRRDRNDRTSRPRRPAGQGIGDRADAVQRRAVAGSTSARASVRLRSFRSRSPSRKDSSRS